MFRHPLLLPVSVVLASIALALPGLQQGELAKRLERTAATSYEEADLHGMSVLVAFGDDILLEQGWGYADPESRSPAGGKSLYRAGSLTAPFAAVALLELLELLEGSDHDLDTPVRELFEELGEWEVQVDLRQVLSHTSGLPSWRDELDPTAVARDPGSMLAWLAQQAPETDPGTCFAYSPTNATLVALAVERLSGASLPEHLAERLFGPLGMEDTSYCVEGPGRHELARAAQEVGGELMDDGASVQPFDAGALCSTARDLFVFQRALLGGRLLASRSFDSLVTPVLIDDGKVSPFGLGVSRAALGDDVGVIYGGAMSGSQVHVAWYPSFDMTIVLFANGDPTQLAEIERKLARTVFELPEPEIVDLPLDPEQAAVYFGTYTLGCDYYRIRLAGDHLECIPPHEPAFRLLSQGYHVFVSAADNDVRLTFELEDERAMAFVLEQRGVQAYARRLE